MSMVARSLTGASALAVRKEEWIAERHVRRVAGTLCVPRDPLYRFSSAVNRIECELTVPVDMTWAI